LFNYLADKEEVDDFQFGFKKRHSTADCTYVFERNVEFKSQFADQRLLAVLN